MTHLMDRDMPAYIYTTL